MDLTQQQLETLSHGQPVFLKLNETECVVVRKDVFQQLLPPYDDSDWSESEVSALAARTFEDLDNPEKLQ